MIGAGGSLACVVGDTERVIRIAWSPPINGLSLGVDPLSGFFLLCIFVVAGLALLYAPGYFAGVADRPVGFAIACLQGLVGAMALVVLARDVILFLVAWEAMFLTSYFLVAFDAHDESAQGAGFTYLVASHISVVFLFLLFGVLARHAGSVHFAAFATAGAPRPIVAHLCFAAALVGFGVKAGLWPLHGWLPEAHPAAPTPASAVMSGVMIKMGVYGLLRVLTFLGPPPLAWGSVLLVVGGLSAVAGVLLALAQHDLKRLLAYHSVENVGIIVLGISIGLLATWAHAPAVAAVGYAGALLHTLNHGLFKGLLFQAAGAVLHATGSRDIEAQGGLLRRMPVTGALFLVGAVAIAGLPPLNGFVSEWLIYVAGLREITAAGMGSRMILVALAMPLLALVGGLAAACFAKVFGIVFLGEPRTEQSAGAHEVGRLMRAAMGLGAAACIAIGLFPSAAFRLVEGPARFLAVVGDMPIDLLPPSLDAIGLAAALLWIAAVALALGRRWLVRRRRPSAAVTWDCGYAAPTPRMQYTAASFADPVLDPFSRLFHTRIDRTPVEGFFPARAFEGVHREDPGEAAVRWTIQGLIRPLARARALQRGPVQLYLLYILVTLLALLVWQVGYE